MARYMLALLNGGSLEGATIFGPRAAQAFRTPQRRTAPGINGWAHGFAVYDLPGGHRGYGHDGQTLSFMSNLVVVPDLSLGVFVSTNTDTGADLAGRLPGRIVRQFYAPPQVFPRPGSPALAQAADAYRGYFVGSRRAYGGLESFVGLLRSGVEVDVTPDGRLLTHGQDQIRPWVPDGDPASGRFIALEGSERLAFTVSDGRATAFTPAWGGDRFQRASVWLRPTTLLAVAALTVAATASRRWRPWPGSSCATAVSFAKPASKDAPAWSRTARRCFGCCRSACSGSGRPRPATRPRWSTAGRDSGWCSPPPAPSSPVS
jgi:Beta-lactamase